jgi:hypothetical protein
VEHFLFLGGHVALPGDNDVTAIARAKKAIAKAEAFDRGRLTAEEIYD